MMDTGKPLEKRYILLQISIILFFILVGVAALVTVAMNA